MPRSTLFIDNGGYSIKALYFSTDGRTATAADVHGASSTSSTPSPCDNHFSNSTSLSGICAPKVLIIPNCVGAAPHAGTGILGDQLTRLPHYHGLMVRRPVDRGFIVDGSLQARIWEHVLQHFAIAQEAEVDVWLTVPFGAPKAIAQLLWLLCTRSFHFHSVTLVSSSFLSLISYSFGAPPHTLPSPQLSESEACLRSKSALPNEVREEAGTKLQGDERVIRKRSRNVEDIQSDAACASCSPHNRSGTAIVVDVGFSGTTIIPYIDFLPVVSSSIRLDVGGKLLTNRLKEFLSFSQVNVMEDTWLINYVRERCCVVALQPQASLERYAAMWKGKSRADVESALKHESTRGLPVENLSNTPTTTTRAMGGRCGGNRAGVKKDPEAEDMHYNAPGSPSSLTSVINAVTPVRFYLPTIPALLPLGVLEVELPHRLPKTTAVDASALQHLLLCHERFMIPELVFTPGDVGLDQQGLSQAVSEGVFQRGLLQHVVTLLKPQLLRRVCVYGGVAGTPFLLARLQREVQAAALTFATQDIGGINGEVAGEDGAHSTRSEIKDDHDSTVAHRSCHGVEPPPLIPELLEIAITEAMSPDVSSVDSTLSLMPLVGAFHILSASTSPSPFSKHDQRLQQTQDALVRLRTLVQQRSTVPLQNPTAGKVTVETFQDAMRQLM